LEGELEELLEARAGIDARIADVEKRIEHLKGQLASKPKELFGIEALPDIRCDQVGESKTIRRASSLADKYQLFMALFAGRPDVHARRFQRKDESSGYSPVCANQFNASFCPMSSKVKGKANCITCVHQDFSPITIKDFEAHLRGSDERCCDVLGAYPMDGDDFCSFIIADFDGKKKAGDDTIDAAAADASPVDANAVDAASDAGSRALEAASTFRQVCLKNQVPVYLEISRSGKGYHVWLFFSERAPTIQARRLFSKLWTITMEQHPGLDFSVYDRFIPCQDTLSSHGLQGSLGNLVALPFQGRVGKDKRTSFLDAQLNPYPDQWEFLSRIMRFSPDELDEAVKRLLAVSDVGELALSDDESSPKPWEKRRPAPSCARLTLRAR
jgi:hypothetical protein